MFVFIVSVLLYLYLSVSLFACLYITILSVLPEWRINFIINTSTIHPELCSSRLMTAVIIACMTWLMSCQSQWNIGHKPLISIKFCLHLPPAVLEACWPRLFHVFFGLSLLLWPCGLHLLAYRHFTSAFTQTSSIFLNGLLVCNLP